MPSKVSSMIVRLRGQLELKYGLEILQEDVGYLQACYHSHLKTYETLSEYA